MDVVLQWCKGAKFSEICKLTDVFEGSVIRCFRRLQELLRQMGMAAGAIGNTELEEKFGKSLDMLERPNTVVFNPSYVTSLLGCDCQMLTIQTVSVMIMYPFALDTVPTYLCIISLSLSIATRTPPTFRSYPVYLVNLIPLSNPCRPIRSTTRLFG